jgi:hypothetical protein
MEQAQVEDFTNLDLTQGKPRCLPPKSLSFIFETLFIILFDCALSLQDLYGTIVTLGFSFLIILIYPCYNSYRSLELARHRYKCRQVPSGRKTTCRQWCSYTHCYWSLMLEKMETGRGYLGGPVEHSEGKGGKSVAAILRFLCGIPRL